jgi:hypothetical protein
MTELVETRRGEILRSNDNRYERFVYGRRYADEIVKMSQVRGEQNIVKPELVADIDQNGLINPIDVGIISEELLEQYIGFVKKTWGEAAELADFAHLRQDDGTYTLLIAGHSRHQAIDEIEESECLKTGQMVRNPIPVKIHDIGSVWDIIRIQLGENIHSQPPKERQAIALVDAFEYGVEIGEWANVDEFLEATEYDEVTPNSMKQALQFRKLPADIRNYVLAGPVHYYAGIELAKTMEPLRRYHIAKLGIREDQVPLHEASIAELVKQDLAILAHSLVIDKLNSTASKARIAGVRNKWNEERAAILGGPKKKNTLELDFVTEDMAQTYIRQKTREITAQLHKLASLKGDDVTTMIQLAESRVGSKVVQECLELQLHDAEQSIQRGRRALGQQASQGAEAMTFMELDLEQTA